MRELDYRPHSTAQALKRGRAEILGVIFARPTSETTPARLLFEIEHAAGQAGYDICLISLHSVTVQTLNAAVDRLASRQVGAIVLVSVHASTREAVAGLRTSTPLVAIWPDADLSVPTVRSDQRAHARLATRHLLELGHRQVHHIAGPASWTLSEVRVAGWREELLAAGIAPPPVVEGDWTPQSGYAAAEGLLADPAVTAIFVANDAMAFGALAAARAAGRDVPTEVSIVGFDDDPAAAFSAPALTTVRLDQAILGQAAFDLAQSMIEGKSPPPHPPIGATLVVRGSTRAPTAGSGLQ